MTYNEKLLNEMYDIGPEKWAEENLKSALEAEALKKKCEHGLQSPFSRGKWDSEAIFSFTIEACEYYINKHTDLMHHPA